ncbi:MAG: Transcription elongation factor GreA [Candidatus Aerophobetes bacterium ADurb.Bin490]|nr:MAG: Transcription elongation factor GreA [Candidatus Aerophobetes bacterium ADurb.Bin490]HNZ28927.1 GreA/GreB family elongation factor [Candidatus Goldiibacteriota bacterium]HPI02228.1 GreA/GreB family elongation factor [Candidatus Goldiibacteriota bacterium]HPN65660.1 GreA/GreB family elongation factor [Candidatus Goldiibacteriota bacterium]HRQ43605.1 GreA/GreB family elongation factor [Candidatus Goldiibacteriota bacterium]
METKEIYVYEDDVNAIKRLTSGNAGINGSNRKYFDQLLKEISRAKVIKNGQEQRKGLVRIGSTVEMIDEDTGEKTVFKLVLPAEADAEGEKVSVLAPIGTAVIGYSENDIIEWKVPLGIRRIKLNKVDN